VALDSVDIFQQLGQREGNLRIPETRLIQQALLSTLFSPARIDRVLYAAGKRLSGKAICYSFDCVGLVGLVLKFEFHNFCLE
jgi:hypothetical protein